MPAALEARAVTKRFGGLVAVNELDLIIEEGAIASLIGPNGAGKTTFFNMVAGLFRPSSGSIRFQEREIAGLAPHQIARLGVGRTFQNIRLFGSMSAIDNVLVGMHARLHASPLAAIFRTAGQRTEETQAHAQANDLLALVGLQDRRDEWARSLPYGDQRRLELARALGSDPTLLLLDEPTAGMNPQEKTSLMRLVERIREQLHLSILVIEHDMKVVMGISDRVTVLDHGQKIAEGTPHEVQHDTQVIEAYLGRAAVIPRVNGSA